MQTPSTNLANHVSKGSFTFIDALSQGFTSPATSLPQLYDEITRALEPNDPGDPDDDQPNLVVLDGLSLIEWSGTPLLEVKRFIRALRVLCANASKYITFRCNVSDHP